MNGQDYPPPPPEDEPTPQTNATIPAGEPVEREAGTPPRKRTCPGCNDKIGLRYLRNECPACRTLYHSKCFEQGGITVSSETGIILFPKAKQRIVDRVIASKMSLVNATDEQKNDYRNKLVMMPQEELIKGTSQTFCRLCAPIVKERVPKVAKDFEKAGRYEDAAKLLEEFGMIDAAGATRKKGKGQVVTNISVDLNELLDKLKSGGLVSVYKCPNCGGNIKISGNSTTQKLSKCEYCGSVLQTDDLVNFIRDILT